MRSRRLRRGPPPEYQGATASRLWRFPSGKFAPAMPDASLNIGNARTLRWTDPGVLAFHRQRLGGLDFFREMARGGIPAVPVYSVLDMRLTDVERGYCRFECDPGPHMVNPVGGIHGGVYAILADSAAGIAAQSWIEEGFVTRTVRLNVDFLRPLTAESGTVVCEGRTAKVGRTVLLSDATIVDGRGRDVGRAQGTFMVVPAGGSGKPAAAPPAAAEREFLVEWGDTDTIRRASAGRTGFEVMSMIADGRLPAAPIAQTLGFRLDSVGDGAAAFLCDPAERQYNPLGIVHGGVPATLIDSAAGCAVHTKLPAGYSFSTVSLTCEFFRAIALDTGPVRCEGRVVKHGRQVSVADADVVDRDGRVLVRGTATCLAHPLR
ncbi:MAG: PaaI family thioesterase [Rhodospirillaceae bacterium]|nr:PaaI family thioesterase [Rhodospirillaceae bacterium]MYB11916.1 PaaI family thioesterase [Rhodospirillaceae bacterium]MYI48625.1 PaaI family thioesterase [Rhodospirillaceae bacterium]